MIKSIFLILSVSTLWFAEQNDCPHAISVAKVENVSSETKSDGSIKIEVKTNSSYSCTLSRISASKGAENIETKSSSGNSSITFSSLKKYKLYQVKVEFVGEDGDCQVLELFPISVE